MNNKHKGALAELKACAWLIELGYEVYRNVSQHGVIDLIAINPETEEEFYFDVKTVYNLKYGLPNSKTSRENILILAYVPSEGFHVFEKGSEIDFKPHTEVLEGSPISP